MSESSAATPADAVASEASGEPDDRAAGVDDGRSARRPRSRREWLDGGTSTRRWGWEVFGWALLALGAGLIASAAFTTLVGGELGATLSLVATWTSLAVAVVLAFRRSVPRGLLRFHPVDVLYGVALGGMLRLAQGWIAGATGGSTAWPSYPSVDGRLPPRWWFDELVATVVAAPLLEEFFFRAVIVVAVYAAVRRIAGRAFGAVAAASASVGLFVLAHAVLTPLELGPTASLVLLALVAAVLVLSTGRIWGAVLTHVVYNATWVALATLGTLLTA